MPELSSSAAKGVQQAFEIGGAVQVAKQQQPKPPAGVQVGTPPQGVSGVSTPQAQAQAKQAVASAEQTLGHELVAPVVTSKTPNVVPLPEGLIPKLVDKYNPATDVGVPVTHPYYGVVQLIPVPANWDKKYSIPKPILTTDMVGYADTVGGSVYQDKLGWVVLPPNPYLGNVGYGGDKTIFSGKNFTDLPADWPYHKYDIGVRTDGTYVFSEHLGVSEFAGGNVKVGVGWKPEDYTPPTLAPVPTAVKYPTPDLKTITPTMMIAYGVPPSTGESGKKLVATMISQGTQPYALTPGTNAYEQAKLEGAVFDKKNVPYFPNIPIAMPRVAPSGALLSQFDYEDALKVRGFKGDVSGLYQKYKEENTLSAPITNVQVETRIVTEYNKYLYKEKNIGDKVDVKIATVKTGEQVEVPLETKIGDIFYQADVVRGARAREAYTKQEGIYIKQQGQIASEKEVVVNIAKAKGIQIKDINNLSQKEIESLLDAGADTNALIGAGAKYETVKAAIDVYNAQSQISPTIIAQLQKEKETQDKALSLLTSGGYRSTKIEYPQGGAPFEAYKTEGGYGYDVWKFIKDNPTDNSIQVLKEARFNLDTINQAEQYIKAFQETMANFDVALSAANIKQMGGIYGVNPNALGRAMAKNDIKPKDGSFVVAWRDIKDDSLKTKIINDYNSDPDSRNVVANIAADLKNVQSKIEDKLVSSTSGLQPDLLRGGVRAIGGFLTQASFFLPIATAGLLDEQIEKFKNFDTSKLQWQDVRTGKVISNEEHKALGSSAERDYYVLSSDTIDSLPIISLPKELVVGLGQTVLEAGKVVGTGGLETGKSLATLALVLAPFKDIAIGGIKGLVARARPDTLTGNAIALNSDVGRVELPKGMAKMAARQLVEDVESAQLVGEIPIERVASYTDIRKGIPDTLKSLDITRNPEKGTVDIVLKSADGNVIGHVSGFQRIMNDVVFHATGDADLIMNDIKKNGYFQVEAEAGSHPLMYFSPQAAQDFMFRSPGNSPGIIAVRITSDMWKELPKEVLDSPTISIMRDRMFQLADEGKLEPGLYPLNKGYGMPIKFEYEVVVAPGTKLYPADATWYAPDKSGAPMTRFTSDVNYDGSNGGVAVKVGQQLPMYWLGTKEAIGKGLGVPSVIDMYAAKFLGDLTALRKWMPWNLRIRPKPTEELGGVTSPNPLWSSFQQLQLKARPEDVGVGRVSGLIYNEKGEVLLTRTQGANHYDLPGGGTLENEGINKAIVREVFEETGLKPTYVEHIDTLESVFEKGGEPRKFQIFQIEAEGKPLFGREVAEYVWWDGKTPLNYEVAPFTKLAINRSLERIAMLDNATVAKVIDDVFKKAKEKSLNDSDTKVEIVNELKKISDESDRSVIPYKSMVDNKAIALSSLSAGDTVVYNEPPLELRKIVSENKAIINDGVIDYGNTKTVEVPKEARAQVKDWYSLKAIKEVKPAVEYKASKAELIEPVEVLKITEAVKATEPLKILEPLKTIEPIKPTEPIKGIEPIKVPEKPVVPLSPEKPIIPEKPTIPSVPEKPIIQIMLPTTGEGGDRFKKGVDAATVEWRQGNKWVAVPPPYDKQYYLDNPLPGTYKYATGKGSAYSTLQVLGGLPPSDVDLDMGWAKIHISAKDGSLTMNYAGGKQAAEDRWAEEQTRQSQQGESQATQLQAEAVAQDLPWRKQIEEGGGEQETKERIPSIRSDLGFERLNKHLMYAHGVKKVYSVNGEYVRDKLSETYPEMRDFTQGGNWKVYPNVIPRNEHWVDETLHPRDFDATSLHEVVEPLAMGSGRGKGEEYEEAHDEVANSIEYYARQHPERLKSMIHTALGGDYRSLLKEASNNGVDYNEKELEQYQPRLRVYNNSKEEKGVAILQSRKRVEQTEETQLPVRTYLGRRLRPRSLGVRL